jgi:hypothetical protein
MKKIIFALTISAALLSSAFTYAADSEPGIKVQQAFNKEFKKAGNVEWSTLDKAGVYQAKFNFNNETLQAFFTEEGEFLGTTRQILKSQLPIMVTNELEKQYPDDRLVTIFEYSKKDGLEYYITMSGNKGGFIVKSNGSGDLSLYKKNVK